MALAEHTKYIFKNQYFSIQSVHLIQAFCYRPRSYRSAVAPSCSAPFWLRPCVHPSTTSHQHAGVGDLFLSFPMEDRIRKGDPVVTSVKSKSCRRIAVFTPIRSALPQSRMPAVRVCSAAVNESHGAASLRPQAFHLCPSRSTGILVDDTRRERRNDARTQATPLHNSRSWRFSRDSHFR